MIIAQNCWFQATKYLPSYYNSRSVNICIYLTSLLTFRLSLLTFTIDLEVKKMRNILVVISTLLSVDSVSALADCPNCAPVPVQGAFPWFTTTSSGSFITTNSSRFHNRPLYGSHNSALILSGDRPITHLADDYIMYGGFLFGIIRSDAAVWAFNFDNITSIFSPNEGSVMWQLKDASLPGLTIFANVASASTGKGMVIDINVTDTSGIGEGELVWAMGCGNDKGGGGQKIGWQKDPLINTGVLEWTFSPSDCVNNKVSILDPSNTTIEVAFGQSKVGLVLSTSATSTSITIEDANVWANISSYSSSKKDHLLNKEGSTKQTAQLPISGASLWLRAQSLIGVLSNNTPVTSWQDESAGSTAILTQSNSTLQPHFIVDALGSVNEPGIRFDGEKTFLYSSIPTSTSDSTMFAVFKDEGTTCDCCSGVLFFTSSFNGISTLTAQSAVDDDDQHGGGGGTPIVTTLDYPGSAAYGHTNIRNRIVVASAMYTTAGPSTSYVDGCQQYQSSTGGTTGTAGGVQVGTRNNELQRFFRGVVGEIVVFNRALNSSETQAMYEYFSSVWPSMPPKQCAKVAPLAVGKSPILSSTSGDPTTRFTFLVSNDATSGAKRDPLNELILSRQRASYLTITQASTPEPLVNAALASMGLAVDGLWRDDPGVFVHGAMAWDSIYVGWRSEYGGTVLGRPDLVAREGELFFSEQVTTAGDNTQCVTSPSLRHTQEDKNSRFYGVGHIGNPSNGYQGFYDMQSQFFDQQLHMVRWTGNTTHEALLRSALKLHVQWAQDSFDHDNNGLFSSYINTWPTDSQFYSGGETYEETSYIYLAALGLRDMALRTGNETEAAIYSSLASTIQQALPQLWVTSNGHPSSHREESGHRRLRPDPWLYSVFLPIEAGLFTQEEAAQALFYTEWGLERDPIFCDTISSTQCGNVVWTSNWIPSQWSVRQLWSGDNSGLSLAYFLTGLPDDGFNNLYGNLHRDMLQSAVPGMTGGSNGGTDFNDCVHPLSRTIVSGLFGYLPDYLNTDVIGGTVTIAPQFPKEWNVSSLSSVDASISYLLLQETVTLNATLTKAAGRLVLKVPISAESIVSVEANEYLPTTATFGYTLQAGFGQTIVVATLTSSSSSDLVSFLSVTVTVTGLISRNPSITLQGEEGQQISLSSPSGVVTLSNYSDPQGVFTPGSVKIQNGIIMGEIAAGVIGSHLVFGYGDTTAGNLPQILLFKLNISASSTSPNALLLPSSLDISNANWWTYVPLDSVLNADLGNIFKAGTYLSPRPETCAVRVGDDGWSAWTFPYWGTQPPVLDFANVANITLPGNQGIIKTPQGAQFLFNKTIGMKNIAFASLWDLYPSLLNVTIAPQSGAKGVWVLVAGSTNPMQTKFANAALTFTYSDGTSSVLNLVPPFNYWALSGWGSADYNYETDSFILPPTPPPTVQLGGNNRAMVYFQPINPGATLVQVSLEAISLEIVVGILGVSLMG